MNKTSLNLKIKDNQNQFIGTNLSASSFKNLRVQMVEYMTLLQNG